MKAIVLHQPYAALVAMGLKRYETRTWSTRYRGPLAICAAARPMTQADRVLLANVIHRESGSWATSFWAHLLADPPRGAVVALADVANVREMAVGTSWEGVTELEESVGHWEPGNYAWRLENVRALKNPLPIKGRQGLWTLTDDVAAEVLERAGGGA